MKKNSVKAVTIAAAMAVVGLGVAFAIKTSGTANSIDETAVNVELAGNTVAETESMTLATQNTTSTVVITETTVAVSTTEATTVQPTETTQATTTVQPTTVEATTEVQATQATTVQSTEATQPIVEAKETEPEVKEEPALPQVVITSEDEVYMAVAQANANTYAGYISEVYALINARRAEAGVAPVAYDGTLTLMSSHRATENAMNDWFVVSGHHMRPNGDVAASVCNIYGQQGSFGEIMGRYQSTPAEIVEGWVNSASHYAAMTNPTYTRVGVGVAADSEGYLYWTAILMD